jgi:hypothetical protein
VALLIRLTSVWIAPGVVDLRELSIAEQVVVSRAVAGIVEVADDVEATPFSVKTHLHLLQICIFAAARRSSTSKVQHCHSQGKPYIRASCKIVPPYPAFLVI